MLAVDTSKVIVFCAAVRDLELRKSGLEGNSRKVRSMTKGEQTLPTAQLDFIARCLLTGKPMLKQHCIQHDVVFGKA